MPAPCLPQTQLYTALVDLSHRAAASSSGARDSANQTIAEELRFRALKLIIGDSMEPYLGLRRRALDLAYMQMAREEQQAASMASTPAPSPPPSTPGTPLKQRSLLGLVGGGAAPQPSSAKAAGAPTGGSEAEAGSNNGGESKPKRGAIMFRRFRQRMAGPDLGSWAGVWKAIENVPGAKLMPLLTSVMQDRAERGGSAPGSARLAGPQPFASASARSSLARDSPSKLPAGAQHAASPGASPLRRQGSAPFVEEPLLEQPEAGTAANSAAAPHSADSALPPAAEQPSSALRSAPAEAAGGLRSSKSLKVKVKPPPTLDIHSPPDRPSALSPGGTGLAELRTDGTRGSMGSSGSAAGGYSLSSPISGVLDLLSSRRAQSAKLPATWSDIDTTASERGSAGAAAAENH